MNWGYAPSAVLSVPRLLESKPFFQQPSESSIKKKKTLIVNAITLRQMDDNQKTIFSERIIDSERHGFTAREYPIRSDETFFSTEQEAAKYFNLARDEVLLLSDEDIAQLMNDLLMTRSPDGRAANNPGFLLIGTQNPVTFAGRVKASTALWRHMQSVSIPEYTSAEMASIL